MGAKTSVFQLCLVLLLALGVSLVVTPDVARAYEAPSECSDNMDNDGDGWTDGDDPDCIGELICQNDVDDDGDGLFDRGRCWDGVITPTAGDDICLTDADCVGSLDGALCNVGLTPNPSVQDPDCMCMLWDTGIGENNDCNAGDVTTTFVATPSLIVFDTCTSQTDTITISGVAAQYAKGSGGPNRPDIQTWISLDGGDGRSGFCAQLILNPAAGSCEGGTNAGEVCTTIDDCPDLTGTCDLTNPSSTVPSGAQLGSGDGPLRNDDGDKCAEIQGNDNTLGEVDAIYNIPYPLTFACTDSDDDGFVDVTNCTGWDVSSSVNDCTSISSDTAPSNTSKCKCDVAGGTIPVSDITLDCNCVPSIARPGWTSTCSLTYVNSNVPLCDDSDLANPACSLDTRLRCTLAGTECADAGAGTCTAVLDEDLRCASSAYVAFDVDYDDANGMVSGLSTSGPGTAGAGGTAMDVAGVIDWEPVNKRDAPRVISNNETGTLAFDYTIDGGFVGTDIVNPVTMNWTSDANGDPDIAQTLTATCDIAVDPTYAALSSFRAYEDNNHVVVEWKTALERETVGFELYRRGTRGGEFRKVNDRLLPGTYHLAGGIYRFVDEAAAVDRHHEYRLIEVDAGGAERSHGPFRVEVERGWRVDRAVPMEAPFEIAARMPTSGELDRLAASRAETSQRRETQRALGAQGSPRTKAVSIGSTGLYQGPQGGRTLRVTVGGNEVPWFHAPGGPVFFGQAIDSAYSAENVYRFEAQAGPRMGRVAGVATAAVPGLSFAETAHFERGMHLRTYLADGPNDDYWYWLVMAPAHPTYGDQTVSVEIHHPTGLGAAKLSLDVYGSLGTNQVEVWLNGVQIGEPLWQGAGPRHLDLGIAPSLLLDGTNDLRFVALQNAVLLDSVDVQYARSYTAVDDALTLRGDGHSVVTVDGFSSSAIYVFDVTDTATPVQISGGLIEAAGGGFRVSFTPSGPLRQYAVASDQGFLAPVSWRLDRPSTLRDSSNAADYLVIAPETLMLEARALADHRKASGLRTMVVALEDILDEFNFGIMHPEAIRTFLGVAHQTWSMAPRFVVLAGAGHVDFKGGLGLGGNLIPPLMVATAADLAGSDSRLGDIDGDGAPEIVVGRIPIVLAQELLDFVDKISAYESNPSGAWSDTALMVADDADHAGNFSADSDALLSQFPGQISAGTLYLGLPHTVEQARQSFIDEINAGVGYVNFLGHGSLTQFAAEGMVRIDEVEQLFNGTQLPIVTALTCYIGYFGFPGIQSIGEEMLLRGEGGASAVWGPSGLSFNQAAVEVGAENFDAFFNSGSGLLGDALLEAYQDFVANGGDPERLKVYNLIGDPATELP